ncbi:hypothetical protein MANES_03G057500v8 [Manihot esculenta]|uniref:Glutamyl-tRNA(Gln) amidotransferase subunit C, chloroplastic/mitochondrial n=1 Tax=Manihot esculenta TaxID=3983 RepID=A0A251L7C3_MANES|nr:hypothetical protein MANES_03G057500v8 [Manihot esculenta]OAY54218.1 hypothetical protein MANES_03G057500v8 [Manihot esculenta]OAY54219.1 hypothetical protein MANES_03G057500v8 [Manihot esculenta]
MGSRALLLLKLPAPARPLSSFNNRKLSSASELLSRYNCYRTRRCFTKATYGSSLEPPNLPRLAETARISLTPDEVEEFAPKIRQVIDWFGQLQAVDLSSVDPAIRAGSLERSLHIYSVIFRLLVIEHSGYGFLN